MPFVSSECWRYFQSMYTLDVARGVSATGGDFAPAPTWSDLDACVFHDLQPESAREAEAVGMSAAAAADVPRVVSERSSAAGDEKRGGRGRASATKKNATRV